MDATPAQRHVQRHNPISIRLHLALDGDWHRIDARQWNARGFCFFHSTPLATGPTAFKRSLQHFEGDIVWSRASHDEAQVTEMLLNEAIHRHAGRSQVQPETQQRLLKLMRVQGMPEAKQRVLSALGGMPQPQEWQDHPALCTHVGAGWRQDPIHPPAWRRPAGHELSFRLHPLAV